MAFIYDFTYYLSNQILKLLEEYSVYENEAD